MITIDVKVKVIAKWSNFYGRIGTVVDIDEVTSSYRVHFFEQDCWMFREELGLLA